MMQEHMNVEERQGLGSTPFTLTVSIPYSPVVRHFGIISLHHTFNIMQWFFFWYSIVLWLMLFLNKYYHTIVTQNLIIFFKFHSEMFK